MRILTYNILDGGIGREPLITEVLRSVRPDVAVLQEATRNGMAERLAGMLSMQVAVVEGNSTRHMALLNRWLILQVLGHHPYPPCTT